MDLSWNRTSGVAINKIKRKHQMKSISTSKLEKHLKDNMSRLKPLIIDAYNKKYPNKNIHLVGAGVFLGDFEPNDGNDRFVAFAYSIAKLKKLFNNEQSTVTIKTTMSNKVDIIVWSGHSYHEPDHFDKYKKSIIPWEQFLYPMVNIIAKDYIIENNIAL